VSLSALDPERIAADFPILTRPAHGRRLVYLDNAATTHKPESVIQAVDTFYRQYNANGHRGLHQLSEEATRAYEDSRAKVARFINAGDANEIVFVRGATEAINLIAASYGGVALKPGDRVLISEMEHHANIVPWQQLVEHTGATLDVIPINDDGVLRMDAFEGRLSERTRIVAVTHASNALGTINPVQRITEAAHAVGAVVVVDGAQAVSHLSVDVQSLDCDFYVLSGHKVFAPTGVGALYGRSSLLADMPPYQTGGEMIREVTFEKTTFREPPARFEAGTPNVAGAIGLGAAIDYVNELGIERIAGHDRDLLAYATQQLGAVPGLRLIGNAAEKIGVLSFALEGVHPHDAATILDQQGIAVRAGHHCAQPTMAHFDVPATLRVSLAPYNSRADIDAVLAGLNQARELFGS
jgi:cysteine desulfurase/selenocysteine lyase